MSAGRDSQRAGRASERLVLEREHRFDGHVGQPGDLGHPSALSDLCLARAGDPLDDRAEELAEELAGDPPDGWAEELAEEPAGDPPDDRAEELAGELTVVALLNCVIRELAGPAGGVRAADGHVLVDLPRTGRTLRAAVRRPASGEPRLTGTVSVRDAGWSLLSWDRLAALVVAELDADPGDLGAGSRQHPAPAGSSLRAEIASSQAHVAQVLRARAGEREPLAARQVGIVDDGIGPEVLDEYLATEQSLIAGHRFHPAPKARSGPVAEALRYAPELRARFALRWLAVPDDRVWQREAGPGRLAQLDRVLRRISGIEPPGGHRLLPVHPWQYTLLARAKALPAALAAGRLLDLGECGLAVRPTSSVRTVDTGAATFLKLALGVQITNCLRLNPRPELTAAVTLTRVLEPVVGDLAARYPGVAVLGEPAVRTAITGAGPAWSELADQLGVIVRDGVTRVVPPGIRPFLAAALTEPWPDRAVTAVLDRVCARRDRLVDWWDAYLNLLLPPVLHAFLEHGVVFEAHLQNVVVGLAADQEARPVHLVLRDLEGVKLAGDRWDGELARLPADAAAHLRYSDDRGWDRVAYCLLVNHVSGVLAVLADRDPGAESVLWSRVRRVLERVQDDRGGHPALRAVLDGGPVPAKANLLTRWRRAADRDTGYVPVALPLGPPRHPPREPR